MLITSNGFGLILQIRQDELAQTLKPPQTDHLFGRDITQEWVTHLEPRPISREQLVRAHLARHVESILDYSLPKVFGNRSAQVAASLPSIFSAMLNAYWAALTNRVGAVAPCSGFHHAGYGFGGGFCTFEGLMEAAQDLLTKNAARKIGILDLDMHWGNSTQAIIDKLGLAKQVAH